jgi:hypothetical protein
LIKAESSEQIKILAAYSRLMGPEEKMKSFKKRAAKF